MSCFLINSVVDYIRDVHRLDKDRNSKIIYDELTLKE
jgi:hypothetical protein